MTKDALREDKERMDDYAGKIARHEYVPEADILYWIVVTIGHILEWICTRRDG